MPDIRCVCLSDLLRGADNGILPPLKPGSIEGETTETRVVLNQFVACLRTLIAHNELPNNPKLILKGDTLEDEDPPLAGVPALASHGGSRNGRKAPSALS